MLCPPFGTGVDIPRQLRDMASDKTSSCGRLASRGTYVVIASFTPPIHSSFKPVCSAVWRKEDTSLFLSDKLKKTWNAVFHISLHTVFSNECGPLDFYFHFWHQYFYFFFCFPPVFLKHMWKQCVTVEQQLFQGGHWLIDFSPYIFFFSLSSNA